MKQVRGIYLPDSDEHFESMIERGPVIDGRGTYQFKKYERALQYFSGRRHAVDIGAHVGLWTIAMYRDFENVTAFEPMPEHLECFSANTQGIHEHDLTLHRVALGPKRQIVSLRTIEDNTGNAHVDEDGETEAEMRTLDSFRLTDVDFIKIDVEGFEYDVLLGAKRTIERERPVIIIEQKPGNAERFGRAQHDALNLLLEWGGRDVFDMGGDHLVVFG